MLSQLNHFQGVGPFNVCFGHLERLLKEEKTRSEQEWCAFSLTNRSRKAHRSCYLKFCRVVCQASNEISLRKGTLIPETSISWWVRIAQLPKWHTVSSTSDQPVLGPLLSPQNKEKSYDLSHLLICLGIDISIRKLNGILDSLMKDFFPFLPPNFANVFSSGWIL